MSTLSSPTNRDEKEQIERGDNVIALLIGSTITAFGATSDGEILLVARKGGERVEFIIGKDEIGEITLYEVEDAEASQ